MLYIFRYFKEIQKSIFVIKTMFEMVLFDWFMCAKVCEELSYVFPSFLFFFFLPFLFRAIIKWRVALLYQSSPVGLLLSFSTYCVDFRFAHVCVFVWSLYPMKQKCWSFVWCAFSFNQPSSQWERNKKKHLIQLIILQFEVIRCVNEALTGISHHWWR